MYFITFRFIVSSTVFSCLENLQRKCYRRFFFLWVFGVLLVDKVLSPFDMELTFFLLFFLFCYYNMTETPFFMSFASWIRIGYHKTIFLVRNRTILNIKNIIFLYPTNVKATPLLLARPVRPMRWM